MDTILIPIAAGFEETEAVANIDIFRRAGLKVVTAGVGDKVITGDHGIRLETDTKLSEVDAADFSAVVLPGGVPGANNLRDSSKLLSVIRTIAENGGLCAAICAAPIVLEAVGVLEGKQATSYPGFGEQMPSANYQEDRVVVDGNLITGRGPGVSFEFALTVVEYLLDKEQRHDLEAAMLIKN